MKELKKELQELADRRFYLDMKSHWEHKDFELDDQLLKRINEIIEEFKQNGIEVNYRNGYEIEYKEVK